MCTKDAKLSLGEQAEELAAIEREQQRQKAALESAGSDPKLEQRNESRRKDLDEREEHITSEEAKVSHARCRSKRCKR